MHEETDEHSDPCDRGIASELYRSRWAGTCEQRPTVQAMGEEVT